MTSFAWQIRHAWRTGSCYPYGCSAARGLAMYLALVAVGIVPSKATLPQVRAVLS